MCQNALQKFLADTLNKMILNNCGDICQPEKQALLKFNEVPTSNQKVAIREKLVKHLSE